MKNLLKSFLAISFLVSVISACSIPSATDGTNKAIPVPVSDSEKDKDAEN